MNEKEGARMQTAKCLKKAVNNRIHTSKCHLNKSFKGKQEVKVPLE